MAALALPWCIADLTEEVVQQVGIRLRLFVTSILLCLAIAVTIFCAFQTIRAIQQFQYARSLAYQGDVNTIQPWMTIHYISHVYAVPEGYLVGSLNVADNRPVVHVPLRTLAVRYNRSVDGIIRDLQTAIKIYRKQNPHRLSFSKSHVNALLALERSVA